MPVHTRGFQNCDKVFDRIFGDDTEHLKKFEYFNNFRYYDELVNVIKNERRKNGVEKNRSIFNWFYNYSNDNEYSLPLEENKVYSELKVIFARKILNEEILFQEKVEFRRLSSLEVEMRVLESGFL